MSNKAELERKCLIANLEEKDRLPEQTALYEHREAWLSEQKYIKEQGGIDAANHKFSEAQATLHEALHNGDINIQQIQNAQNVIQERYKFLRNKAVPRDNIKDKNDKLNELGTDDLGLQNQRVFQNLAQEERSNNPLSQDYLPDGQKYAADHIVSFKRIWKMPGFQELNIVDQLSIIRDGENFQPLNRSLNSSKGEYGYDTWKGLQNGPDLSNDSVYQEVARMESEIEQHLQKRIVEAEIKSSQYITEQGGIDAADHAYSEAQTILTSADQKTNSILDSDKKMLQNAQQIVQDRKEFLSSMAVPQNYVAETVVPFEKIWDMPGFQELNIVDQLSIVRDGENFHSLDTSFNATDHNNFIRIEKHLQDMVTERLHEMNDVKQVEKDFVNSLEPYIEREEERLSDAKDSEIFDNKPETNHEAEKNDEKNTVTSVEEIHEEVIEIDNENEEVIENEDILDEIQEMENIQELNDTNELEELNEQDNIHDNSIEQEEAKNKENEQEYEQEQISNQLTYS